MNKLVYAFKEGNKDMRNILGGKGANLSEMTRMGFPVPRGFIISTDACNMFYENNEILSDNLVEEIKTNLIILENETGKRLGDPLNPLLVSVRSGARASMPGMMDTILNLGINDEVADGLIKKTNNPRFVYDSYRRFIQMFSDVALGLDRNNFEEILENMKNKRNIKLDSELSGEDLKELVDLYKNKFKVLTNKDFPANPVEQLLTAVKAVFDSWNNDRAIIYRKMHNIPSSWGTAVNVQEMVYGNLGETSGTGVAFTRNPATGENSIYGEYLMNAQGEDVVAGIRTPHKIDDLKIDLPQVYEEFKMLAKNLEKHYKDMQDLEFTIENGKLFILQTRNGKRTATAALKIAVDMVEEGLITKEEALLKIDASTLDQLLHPVFDEDDLKNNKPITQGLAASPGAAYGEVYFDALSLAKAKKEGHKDLILVRKETSPEDIEGMTIAHGILTVHGGMTSHAAVVARGMGTCCVSGCTDIEINDLKKEMKINNIIIKEGDFISLDGATGNVYKGKIKTKDPAISGNFETVMNWADSFRKLGIKANADNERDAKVARNFGAEGIGLCRTEHMFFDKDRIFNFRKMILAESEEERIGALSQIKPYQQKDFENLFRVMAGYDVVIRYLDPPLHEFLPKNETEIKELAMALNLNIEDLKIKINSLSEFNPMMGHRGCRLSITYPEIIKMQTEAAISGALNVLHEGKEVSLKIMIPLIGNENELKYVRNIVEETAGNIVKDEPLKYKIGTMIEVPRATLVADKIAHYADFFSFGTNDLTQMTFGFSRDDAGSFLNDYYSKNILVSDPFAHIDQEGVGALVKIATLKGREANPHIELGICGEHGGDPDSIDFFNRVGLDYVSCSPYRVPIARLAAAQAAIQNKKL